MAAANGHGIAVVGLGPRGVGALEALATLASRRGLRLTVDLFDPHPSPGAGPNFDPDESDLCRLNIPMRDIDLRVPETLDTLPLADWLSPSTGRDTFPPRPSLGTYLQYRLGVLTRAPGLNLACFDLRVKRVWRTSAGWHLDAGGQRHGPYREVLLVPGQPPTRPDDQLSEWQAHAATGNGILAQAYPARQLLRQAGDWAGKTVAVRGLALSSFDVVRVLTQGLGGRFTGKGYRRSGQEPDRILPFSLDGQPPFPKPQTADVDAGFTPTEEETAAFRVAMAEAAVAFPDVARQRITSALIPPVQRILSVQDGAPSGNGIATWLATEWTDPGAQEGADAVECLRAGIAMADGTRPPSIGYAVGQVWRWWQNPLRQGYNPAGTPPETAAQIVGFDEGLKRYSYGPPVDACRELLVLIETGLVSTAMARDPEITPVDAGWRLRTGNHEATADVMVDAVLPPPDPRQVTDPMIAELLRDGWLTGHDDLGARTGPDGRLIGRTDQPAPGLSLLGRLALGSVIAADSLHDCFGAASRRWAEGVVSRMSGSASGHFPEN
jgi:uncharacterized NAD(P)/FAD-binding protein YdhS